MNFFLISCNIFCRSGCYVIQSKIVPDLIIPWLTTLGCFFQLFYSVVRHLATFFNEVLPPKKKKVEYISELHQKAYKLILNN